MSADLLFEIGCEEIPAAMLTARSPSCRAGRDPARGRAPEPRGHPGARDAAADRGDRPGLADRQPDLNEEVVGPPAGAAFAADGSVTKAARASRPRTASMRRR